jgi:hypothetical protein
VIQEGVERQAKTEQLRLERFVTFVHGDLIRDGL